MTVPADPEATWREVFAAEMTRLGASAQTIDFSLADVDDRCRTEGRDPQEAYGDPKAFARAILGRQSPVAEGSRPEPVMARQGIPAGTVLAAIAVVGIVSVATVVYLFLQLK